MEEPKDQNVYSFMMQLVQERHGDEVDMDFLNREAEQMYDVFGGLLLSYFEPQLDEAQKKQFDQLLEAEEDQEVLMQFLVENISDLEQQIVQVLVQFRQDYLAEKLDSKIEELVGDSDADAPEEDLST